MTKRQYETEAWLVDSTYTREDGSTGFYWRASLDGLRQYAAEQAYEREQRISAAITRREADESWSKSVEQMVERLP